jgi:hypothetical protein
MVLAIGYLRLFKGVTLPGTEVLLTSTWLLIMLAYAVRRLPYALRACVAALQQVHVSLEEAAQSVGATRVRTDPARHGAADGWRHPGAASSRASSPPRWSSRPRSCSCRPTGRRR